MNLFRNPNRANKRKQKKGAGCKMCKPWKGKWEAFFKLKEKFMRKDKGE